MLALVAAMPPELSALQACLQTDQVHQLAGRTCHVGRLGGHEVVMCLSGIGKVAAAATATLLCQHFGARAMLFTGVAGGLGTGVRVGDVVVARQLLQHDMDASPLFPRWVVPGLGRSHFDTDAAWTDRLVQACQQVLSQPSQALQAARAGLGLGTAQCHEGLVISGDRFVATAAESDTLRRTLPAALAVEMEGAATGQVCADFGCPLAVLRSISDRADDQAHLDFERFLTQVAADLARDIVLTALDSL